LDLLARADKLPTTEDLRASLATGLAAAADALNLGPLQLEVSGDKILVKKRDNSLLFKVDITRVGPSLKTRYRNTRLRLMRRMSPQ
jgi:hypothetical protein